MRKTTASVLTTVLLLSATTTWAFEPDTSDKMQLKAAEAILEITEADPNMQRFFEESAGYAVFPSVGKGGIGIGGAHGKGLVIVNGKVDGRASLSQISIGFQLGGQKYSEFIFFRDQAALDQFRRGNFELGAQASAVAVKLGASADADYDKGVAVFTHVKGGLMYEAAIAGQKFKYKPGTE
jgi:lipid-binding SYLF domain-containing protein